MVRKLFKVYFYNYDPLHCKPQILSESWFKLIAFKRLYYVAANHDTMKYSTETMMAFYQKLGNVFYAVAAADKVVRKEELSELKKMIKSEWLSFDTSFDEFGTDSAYQIEIVFDWLEDNKMDIKRAVPALKEFKEQHPSLFTKPVNELILKTADAIASSFSGKDEPELDLLNELKILLQVKT